MDKWTKGYLLNQHGHMQDSVDLGQMMDYIKQGGEDGYLSQAIEDNFTGVQKDFLQMKLLEEMYKRRG
jgi:hypothetical protein